jgi:hypothetical protein
MIIVSHTGASLLAEQQVESDGDLVIYELKAGRQRLK